MNSRREQHIAWDRTPFPPIFFFGWASFCFSRRGVASMFWLDRYAAESPYFA
jgi:hypothetical protein